MLSSLCSYTCNDPELLNDVRIVIIDKPTFGVFLKFFQKEKENLKLLQYARPSEDFQWPLLHLSMVCKQKVHLNLDLKKI